MCLVTSSTLRCLIGRSAARHLIYTCSWTAPPPARKVAMNHESIDLEPLCVEQVQVEEVLKALIHCWTSFTIRVLVKAPVPDIRCPSRTKNGPLPNLGDKSRIYLPGRRRQEVKRFSADV